VKDASGGAGRTQDRQRQAVACRTPARTGAEYAAGERRFLHTRRGPQGRVGSQQCADGFRPGDGSTNTSGGEITWVAPQWGIRPPGRGLRRPGGQALR